MALRSGRLKTPSNGHRSEGNTMVFFNSPMGGCASAAPASADGLKGRAQPPEAKKAGKP
jgi:hypothetical protein